MTSPITVLQQFPVPRPTTNPYLIMLADHLRAVPGVTVLNFTWMTAFRGRYDVFHVHWPEILGTGNGALKSLARQVLTVLLLVRLAATRTPIVRTVHNVELPSGLNRRQRALLRLIDRRTAHRITLNTTTTLPAGQDSTLIPHGHYREWFARYARAEAITGRLGYFGLVRRYKGVETLLDAFDHFATRDAEVSLRIGGRPSTPELQATVEGLVTRPARTLLDLHFLSDAELVDIATGAELVVLPYRFMHNSGSTLAALSLDRPVLVPDNEVNRALESEVGPGWVHRFTGELDAEDLTVALAAVRSTDRATPVFRDREWGPAATRHVEAYRRAIRSRPRRSKGLQA